MGGASNRSDDSGGGSSYSDQLKKSQKKFSFKSVKPLAISILEGFGKQKKAARQNLMDYEGAAAGVTKQRTNADAMREKEEGTMQSSERLDNPIASMTMASSGIVTSTGMVAPTTAEVSQATATDASSSYSSDATLLANNIKGRRSTILQKAKGLGDSNLNTTKRTLGA